MAADLNFYIWLYVGSAVVINLWTINIMLEVPIIESSVIKSANKDIGIIGFGSSSYDKIVQKEEFGYLWDAAKIAIDYAGVQKFDIDGLAISSTTLGGDNAVTAAEHFGLSLNWAHGSVAGGAGGVAMIMRAIEAVEQGKATYVLCLAGASQDREKFGARAGAFNSAVARYLTPHGTGGMNGLFAMIQRKHMERYGTTRHELGRIAVGQRMSASYNPQALFRQILTMDDYLNAPVIADPLGLYDCVLPCSGAEAILIGPLDHSKQDKGVRILSSAERYNHPMNDPVPLSGGWETFRDEFYASAGQGPGDSDFLQCYDDYPIMVAIQVEDLGFCKKGEVGRHLSQHSMHWSGSFPINTGGGQLSCGQAGGGGGLIGVVEAARQLCGEAGDRQIFKAKRGVVAGYGMVSYGHGLAASAIYVEALNED